MPTSERTKFIVRDFSKEENPDQEKWTVAELEEAIADLGWRDVNSSPRVRIDNRIKFLKSSESKVEQRTYESKVRAWNLITGILIGLVIAVIANLIF